MKEENNKTSPTTWPKNNCVALNLFIFFLKSHLHFVPCSFTLLSTEMFVKHCLVLSFTCHCMAVTKYPSTQESKELF